MIKSLETDRYIDSSVLKALVARDTDIIPKRINLDSKADNNNTNTWMYFVFKSKDGNIYIVDSIGNIYKHDTDTLLSKEDLKYNNYLGRCYNIWVTLGDNYPFKLLYNINTYKEGDNL